MITRQELQDLAAHPPKADRDAHYVSLYLNVDPKDNPKGDYLLHFKNLAKNAIAAHKHDLHEDVKADIMALEKFLADRPAGMKRGLAVISSRPLNIWRHWHTAQPFVNQLVIERDPFIKPLVTMLDQLQRYLVVVVAGAGARIFIAGSGEIHEVTSLARPLTTSNPTRDGRAGDMGRVRAEHQKEQAQRLLFKDLFLLLERLVRDEDIKRILIGGAENARGRFKDALPNGIKSKIVGEFAVDRDAGGMQILERCLPVMKDAERRFEQKALGELISKTGAREGSVLGLSDVLTALQQGNIRKLYVLSNVAAPGMVCDRCQALTPPRDRPCPYCGGPLTVVNQMHDLVIQRALDQGVRIDMLEDSPDLAKAGGIGALLRY